MFTIQALWFASLCGRAVAKTHEDQKDQCKDDKPQARATQQSPFACDRLALIRGLASDTLMSSGRLYVPCGKRCEGSPMAMNSNFARTQRRSRWLRNGLQESGCAARFSYPASEGSRRRSFLASSDGKERNQGVYRDRRRIVDQTVTASAIRFWNGEWRLVGVVSLALRVVAGTRICVAYLPRGHGAVEATRRQADAGSPAELSPIRLGI